MKYKTKILRPVARSGGVRVPHRKHTAECESILLPPPDEVCIAMQQHIGAPCVPNVKVGDRVTVGQLIGDSDRPISAPIHASVSGEVTKIADMELSNGAVCTGITIRSDGLMTPCERPSVPEVNTLEQLAEAARSCGLVGLGGAGFPASVKLSPRSPIDTLIINGAECEPHITADYRECIENPDDILRGVYTVGRLLGVDRIIIAIESNKPRAIELLSQIAARDDQADNKCRIMQLPAAYPQGAEKVIIHSATGRVVPIGGLPSDVGCVVMNVTSIATLARYLKDGMPLVSRRITVDGTAVARPCNLIAPLGTPLDYILSYCGASDVAELLMGGPMMGIDVCNPSTTVLKQTNAVLAFNRPLQPTAATACIRCSECVRHCPMHLMPVAVEQALRADDTARLKKLRVDGCMECGCCAYGCPAHRPLVQSMKLAKQKVRNAK